MSFYRLSIIFFLSTCLMVSADQRSLRAMGPSMQQQMLDAVNKERTSKGLKPLCLNQKLQTAAQLHTNDMAAKNFMSHTGSDRSSMITRIERQRFKWQNVGENVAAGQPTVESVMKAWMNSSGHRANILNANFRCFGMGYAYNAKSTYKHYWTQDFGTSSSEAGCAK